MENITFTIVNPKNGESITSTFTDEEACKVITSIPNPGAFAEDMVHSYRNSVTRGWRFSDTQRFWLHKCAQRISNPTPKAPTTDLEASALVALFATAKANLKFPKIRLR